MPPPDLITLFVVPFNNLDIRYMVTGEVERKLGDRDTATSTWSITKRR